ncbi:MAG: hypothetical protein BWX47_01705 [candidate division Hyd24-12 bacterium ADurb.Bin004]|jgi:hypothetical protein|nr:MAG: hypothetical protein BWX47_01705 [candidate division Hyd24-12 bacterium ADurb.Bin004]
MNLDECKQRLSSLGSLASEATSYIELLKKSDLPAADPSASPGIARRKWTR